MTEAQRHDPAAEEAVDAEETNHDAPGHGAEEAAEEMGVEELRAELEQARAAQMRAVADYQNLQRRSQQERQEYARYAQVALVLNMLPVLDDLNRALESVHDSIQEHPWVEGINLVRQKFRGALESMGVTEIPALGQPFDPERHEAVGNVPGPEGQVIHVTQAGYLLGDRVVRPSMVVVGSGGAAAEAGGEEPPEEQQE